MFQRLVTLLREYGIGEVDAQELARRIMEFFHLRP